jgi:aarF domain-containing kinase
MAGKRLLDVAALFNASRGVAQKHVALRARQVDVYNRTSTLAKAVRNQTDRVTETVKATSFLVSRLNESGPVWASEATDARDESRTSTDIRVPSKESTVGSPVSKPKDGIEQTHFYESSAGNSATGSALKDDLKTRQEKADPYPLPDCTIHQTQSDLNTEPVGHEVLPSRPQDKATKQPLDNEGLQAASSGVSSIPSAARNPLSAESARKLQRQSELQIPSKTADALEDTAAGPLEQGHDEDSFYRKSTHISPVLSSLPRVKLPKHTSNTQEFDSRLPKGQINSDSFYSAGPQVSVPSVEAVPAQDEVPEGVDTALFHSPQVARLLGGKTQGYKLGSLELKGVKDTPIDHTGRAANKDQGTFNIRTSSEQHPTMPDDGAGLHTNSLRTSTISKEDIKDLAQDISSETNSSRVKVRLVAAKIT